jgi:hypothetical protein
MSTLSYRDCCDRVVAAAKTALPGQTILWAAKYAMAGRYFSDPEKMACQAQYILSNLSGWRGDEAKLVKARLKEIANV